MIKLKYKGQIVNLENTLKKGEKELDVLIDDINMEDTIEMKNEYLEDTIKLDTIKLNQENKNE